MSDVLFWVYAIPAVAGLFAFSLHALLRTSHLLAFLAAWQDRLHLSLDVLFVLAMAACSVGWPLLGLFFAAGVVVERRASRG